MPALSDSGKLITVEGGVVSPSHFYMWNMGRLFFRAAIILFISVIAGAVANYFSPQSLAWVFEVKPVSEPLAPGPMMVMPLPDVKNGLYPHQALEELKKKKAVFIDARSLSDFDVVHIKGAMPGLTADGAVNPDVLKLPMAQRLIVYCSSVQCTASAKYAEMLRQRGFKDVQVLIHGIDAWKQARYPVTPQP